jgi:hypothetical protein
MTQVKLLQRLHIPGGASYLPGEVIGLTAGQAADYIERGWAAPHAEALDSTPAPAPVSQGPPVDKQAHGVRKK